MFASSCSQTFPCPLVMRLTLSFLSCQLQWEIAWSQTEEYEKIFLFALWKILCFPYFSILFGLLPPLSHLCSLTILSKCLCISFSRGSNSDPVNPLWFLVALLFYHRNIRERKGDSLILLLLLKGWSCQIVHRELLHMLSKYLLDSNVAESWLIYFIVYNSFLNWYIFLKIIMLS